MPVTFHFDSKLKLVCAKYVGEIHDEEFLRAAQKAREVAEKLHPALGLVDMTHVEVHVTAATARAVAHRKISEAQNVPRVVVAPGNAAFGMARMFQMVEEEMRPNFYVVRTMQEAYRLLGLKHKPHYDKNDL